jgi:6-phospho-3-hexuloisomerase
MGLGFQWAARRSWACVPWTPAAAADAWTPVPAADGLGGRPPGPRLATMDAHRTILAEVGGLLDQARSDEVEEAFRRIVEAPRVFAYASGRSGFVLRGFVMRLNHLGGTAFYVGEASTPPIRTGDVLVAMSGSGSTATTLGAAMEAVKLGASVIAVVGSRVSPLGQLASAVVELPAPHKRGVAAGSASKQNAGSLFEQAAFILLEAMILRRFGDTGGDRIAALSRHANVEA